MQNATTVFGFGQAEQKLRYWFSKKMVYKIADYFVVRGQIVFLESLLVLKLTLRNACNVKKS